MVRAARRHQIAVQEAVGLGAVAAFGQVHQQEGEVVEHVTGGDARIELDGVEQRRCAVEQDDVAEVQVAVAAAHVARGRADREQRAEAAEQRAGGRRERGDGDVRCERRRPPQCRVVLDKVLAQVGNPALRIGRRRGGVGGGHGRREAVDLPRRQRPASDHAVEGRRLVEAPHAQHVLDDGTGAAQREAPVGAARHREDGFVDGRRQRAVDGELGLEGTLAARHRAVVQERVDDRALQLVGHGTGEYHDGAVGIDAHGRDAAVGRRRQEERQYLGLQG